MKLNLGAGDCPLEGWVNWDVNTGQECYPLDLPDACADEIRASHLLEHFSHREVMTVLEEWVRVLKPGGLLKVAVPSWEWIIAEYQRDPQTPDIHKFLLGAHVDANDFHHCVFDAATLEGGLLAVGLRDIEPWVSEQQDCAALPVSLNRQGRKPGQLSDAAPVEVAAAEIPEIKIEAGDVRCVLTNPRFGPLDAHFAAFKALSPLGVACQQIGGVFWYQSMSELFQQHLDRGTKYLLTLDYDSIFETQNVIELIRLLETRSDIDAACAIQMRRERDSPLFCPKDLHLVGAAEEESWAMTAQDLKQEAVQVRTGHFGLTLFRMARLHGVPKPWFGAIPDPEGGWGEGRTDADIAFWKRWRESGRTLFLANRCAIGHLEVMVSWPDRQMKVSHQHVSDWNKHGRPQGVWR